MNFFQALILGIVQGVTEFLPISSSGHLVIFPKIFGWEAHSLVFDTTLHLGTVFALVVYFKSDILKIAKGLVNDFSMHVTELSQYSRDGKMGLKILVGSIPAGFIGFLFGDLFERYFRSVSTVSLFLVLGSGLMYLADKYGKRDKRELNYKETFFVGLFQSLALFPGVSRSGSTISGGLFLGLERKESARFSFLLSIPIVILAGLYKLISSANLISMMFSPEMLVGFISSFLVGVFCIKFLLRFLERKNLTPFVVYRIILAVILLL